MAKTNRPKDEPQDDGLKAVESTEAVVAEEPVASSSSDLDADPIAHEEPRPAETATETATDRDATSDEKPEPALAKTAQEDHTPAPPVREIRIERKGGFVGMVAGGVLAAAAGYGVATYFPLIAAPGNDDRLVSLETTLKAQGDRLAEAEAALAGITALEDRVAAVESREPQTAPAVDLSAVEAAIAGLQDRMAAIEAMPVDGGGASTAALTAALEAVKTEVAELKGQGDAAAANIREMAAEAEARLAEAEAQAAQLKAEAEDVARKARVSAAVGRIQAALESGAPFANALADLEGAEVPEPLGSMAETGVPTVAALAGAFPSAARDALEASRHATMGDSYLDRAVAFLENATGSRSLAPREGNDPDAVLSRAEAAVKAGEIEKALAEVQALPPEGQAALQSWIALAQSRLDAMSAAATLASTISG